MKPSDLNLLKCWQEFAVAAIPKGAPSAQHNAMYQAFVAGCDTILEIELSLRALPVANKASRETLDKWRSDVRAEIERIAKETRH